jgi:hypothetical protein
VLALDEDQVRRRRHMLRAVDDGYEVIAPAVNFKHGEEVGVISGDVNEKLGHMVRADKPEPVEAEPKAKAPRRRATRKAAAA